MHHPEQEEEDDDDDEFLSDDADIGESKGKNKQKGEHWPNKFATDLLMIGFFFGIQLCCVAFKFLIQQRLAQKDKATFGRQAT